MKIQYPRLLSEENKRVYQFRYPMENRFLGTEITSTLLINTGDYKKDKNIETSICNSS